MTVLALCAALDARDPEVRHHSDRVARYAYALGRQMEMDEEHHGRRASAVDELDAHKGTQFDAQITDTLLELIMSGELERGIEPPLVVQVAAGRIHDPEWVVTGAGRFRLGAS